MADDNKVNSQWIAIVWESSPHIVHTTCKNDAELFWYFCSLSAASPNLSMSFHGRARAEVKTLFDAMEVTYDWEQLVVAVRSLRSGDRRAMAMWCKSLVEPCWSISSGHFRSAFWWILHILSILSILSQSHATDVEAPYSSAARCPRPLWHRCFPISTFFVSHSVRIVWFGFACLPSWPSRPAWAWCMSTCQQGRPDETWRNRISFCFDCFAMFRHSRKRCHS